MQESFKIVHPVVLWYNDCRIVLPTSWVWLMVADVSTTFTTSVSFGSAKYLLKQAKTPVRCKFSVVDYHEGVFVKSSQKLPCQILHDIAVLVLAGTVVSVQLEVDFAQVVV